MLYSHLPSYVLGFHGCDESVARSVFEKGKHLKQSRNEYDWLGSGIYFWENSPERAIEWARELRKRGKVANPAVIGAVIDLGVCLNLLDREYLKLVKDAHQSLVAAAAAAGRPLPENKPLRDSRDLLLRYLDFATINLCTELRKKTKLPPFDTVRAAFVEGEPLYKNAGFCDRNHIQVCVVDRRSIKGYFRPLK